ncbi:hypothetical protein KEM52_006251 [Ascosphaera acerosa]|nr:hypothetical protein KEM52_006251 [Ascosphaera acerosa]
MVAEGDFRYEDTAVNEANGPPDPRDPRARFRAYPMRIQIPELSGLASLMLLLPRRVYENQVSRQICDNVDLGMDLVGRSLTQEETDAFVSQASTLVTGPRQGAILGLLAANMLAFRAFRRAVVKPHTIDMARMNMREFPFAKFGVASGSGIFTGAVFGNVWSAATVSRNLLEDARLKQFREDRKHQDADAILKRVRERAMIKRGYAPGLLANGARPAGQPRGAQMGDVSAESGYDTSTVGPYSASATELSPTLVDDGAGSPKTFHDIGTTRQRSEFGNDDRAFSSEDTTSRSSGSSVQTFPGQQYAGQQEQDLPSTSVDGGLDFFDADSSTSADPDSPKYSPTAAGNAGSAARSGSAWDRVRQAAQQGNGKAMPINRNQDSFSTLRSYADSDRQAQFASDAVSNQKSQEDAQREFDEILERERALGTSRDKAREPRW